TRGPAYRSVSGGRQTHTAIYLPAILPDWSTSGAKPGCVLLDAANRVPMKIRLGAGTLQRTFALRHAAVRPSFHHQPRRLTVEKCCEQHPVFPDIFAHFLIGAPARPNRAEFGRLRHQL